MKGGVIVKDRATYNKEFAARLKRYMDRAGLRAVDLSRATGISGGTLSEYLKGKYVPKQIKLYKIAEALHTTPAVLMGATDFSEMAKFIKERRLHLGLTQKEVADYTGVTEATVSRWESGEISNMRRDKIEKLSEILQVDPLSIMAAQNIEEDKDTPSYNLLEVLFKDNPTFLKKISHIEMTGTINEPGVIAKLTKQQQDRIKDIIMLTYEEAVRNGGIGVVHTVSE